MNNLKQKLLLLFCSVVVSSAIYAQDIHFSQFYQVPLHLNPAMTGLFQSDMRVTLAYRNQWATVTVPFEQYQLSYDISLLEGFSSDDYMGFGIMLNNDKAGDSEFQVTQGHVSFAYFKSLNGDGNHYLGLGFQYGGIQRTINEGNLFFDNQFNGGIFDTSIPSGESFTNTNIFYQDVSAGLVWYYAPSRYNNGFFGVSYFHLNEPNVSFYKEVEENLYRRFSVQAGASFRINGIISVLPRFVYMYQGESQEFNLGGMVQFFLNEDNYFGGETSISVGGFDRVGDAFIPMVQLDYANLSVGVSYDANISKLSRASFGVGGVEVTASVVWPVFGPGNRKDTAVNCPKF